MTAVVFKHIPVAELLEKWRAKLNPADGALVTVRIEEVARPAPTTAADAFVIHDPAFGICRDREGVVDVDAYVLSIRQPRYGHDGYAKSLDDVGGHRRGRTPIIGRYRPRADITWKTALRALVRSSVTF